MERSPFWFSGPHPQSPFRKTPPLLGTAQFHSPTTQFYSPKSLGNINVSMILSGEASPERFSSEGWLEDHLHRFSGFRREDLEENSRNYFNGYSFMMDGMDETSDFMTSPHEFTGTDDDNVSWDGSVDSLDSEVCEVLDMLDNATMDYSPPPPMPPRYSDIFDSLPRDPPPSYSDIYGTNSTNRLSTRYMSYAESQSNSDFYLW